MTDSILIIDDEPELLNALQTFLDLRGFSADTESDPERALSRVLEGRYGVVLVDIVMPRMDGLEVLRRIRAERPEVEVVMITANSTRERVMSARWLGAADFILKPFSDLELIAQVILLALERARRWVEVARNSPTESWQEVSPP